MERRRNLLLCLILVFITVALYWPATRFDFVAIDDNLYVTENPHVQQGLSFSNLKWAFTTTEAANFHPVTWFSHMLDFSIYGLFAGGHHLTNLLLHALNSLLLFLLLQRLTKSVWPSFFVAALFAWHPLHVESVAWVSERKDVLSTLFLLLTIWAYARYVETRTKLRYGIALGLFALGLLTKPMLVTLPCVLMLLDYWPLNRFRIAKWSDLSVLGKLFLEKIPFFALSFAASVVTFIAQHTGGAVITLERVPLVMRFLNSLSSYGRYLGKTFYPLNLCVVYPMPTALPVLVGILSVVWLIIVTTVAIRWREKLPWLIVGWLWYLGTLVPVIGIVQVGDQALADRYTYIPLIGFFIMVAWSANYFLQLRPRIRALGFSVGLVALGLCLVLTRNQLGYWRSNIPLFSHAIAVTGDNAVAEQDLGVAFSQEKNSKEAILHFEKALRIRPHHVPTHYNLGIEWFALEEFDKAEIQFSEALRLGSRSEKLENNLGVLRAKAGQFDDAIEHFKQAIAINPDYPKPYLNYATTLQRTDKSDEAVANYQKALMLDPDWPEALNQFAFFMATCPEPARHNPTGAVQLAERANALTESSVPAFLETLAIAYAEAGQFSKAVSTAELARKNAEQNKKLQPLADWLGRDLEFYRAGKIAPRDWKNPP